MLETSAKTQDINIQLPSDTPIINTFTQNLFLLVPVETNRPLCEKRLEHDFSWKKAPDVLNKIFLIEHIQTLI